MRHPRVSRMALAVTMVCIAASSLLLNGCSILSAVMMKTTGPTEVDAQFKPPQKPTLVLVEDYRQGGVNESSARTLAVLIEAELKLKKVAPLVDSSAIDALRTKKGDAYHAMSIPDVGKALGAQQVLYVNIISSKVDTQADEIMRGETTVRVRFVDTASGNALWPDTTEGYEVNIATDYARNQNADARTQVQQQMIEDLSEKISHLFYKYRPDDLRETRENTGYGG